MKRPWLVVAFVGILALAGWWLLSPQPPVPQLRNAPGDAFALGVITQTNRSITCFFANPKEYDVMLTAVRIERRAQSTADWKRFPIAERRRWRVSAGQTKNFSLPVQQPGGDEVWRVVFEISNVLSLSDRIEHRISALLGTPVGAGPPVETWTPDLVGHSLGVRKNSNQ